MHGGFSSSRYGYGFAGGARFTTADAASVKDYTSAKAFFEGRAKNKEKQRDSRPIKYATELWQVQRGGATGERIGAQNGFAVAHHDTPIVVWRRDGLVEFRAHDSVTTKERLNHYLSSLSLYTSRGCFFAMQVGAYHDEKIGPRTPRNIKKCRECKGKGKVEEENCWGVRYAWSNQQPEACGRADSHRSHRFGPLTVSCSVCKGLGVRDYGGEPIPFELEHGVTYLLAGSDIVGAFRDRRWHQVKVPKPAPKPVPVVPLAIEHREGEIVAFRAWRIGEDGKLGPLGLTSLPSYQSFHLPAATCKQGNSHDVPAENCSCGYWAVKNPGHVPFYEASNVALGQVRLWGETQGVIETELGYRSERLTVDYLVVSDDVWGQRVARAYPDVPVYVSDWPLPCPIEELGDPVRVRESTGSPSTDAALERGDHE